MFDLNQIEELTKTINLIEILEIAKNSALNHGGELILEDSPLGGLRVRLLLPL